MDLSPFLSPILAIAPCPEAEAYDGPDRRLITAVFRHTSKNVVDVTLDDNTPRIGCTGNHPYWSVDRQNFLRADELRRGETLQKADGTFCHVASVTKRNLTEPVTVYNLEVDGHHVYCVGEGGVLVHNACVYQEIVNGETKYIGFTNNFTRRANEWKSTRTITSIIDDVTTKQGRALEHLLIEKYKRVQDRFGNLLGGQLDNLNRGIDPRKLKNYTEELEWARNFISDLGL